MVISTRCITLGTMWRAIVRRCGTPKASAACMNSRSRSFSVSARTSRHSVAQPVRPRITQSRKIFRSARSSPVSNISACVSRNTCTISTQAAISSTLGTEVSIV